MAKLNRGKAHKLSIRLSSVAKQQVKKAAPNLGTSQAGIILFELSKLLKDLPSLADLKQMENDITLERQHFVMTINDEVHEQILSLAEDYGMKKNRLIGYIVSDHFEKQMAIRKQKKTDSKQFMLHLNKQLQEKMMRFSEKNYVPLPALVSYAILQGPTEKLPTYDESNMIDVFTTVPEYIQKLLKENAECQNIRQHFYTSACLYKQFMTEEGRFFK